LNRATWLAWAIVRWLFNYIAKRQNAVLAEIAKDVKGVI
jgi:hypothetical protein